MSATVGVSLIRLQCRWVPTVWRVAAPWQRVTRQGGPHALGGGHPCWVPPAPVTRWLGPGTSPGPSPHRSEVTPVCRVPASICLTTSSTLALTSAGMTDSKSWKGARPALPRGLVLGEVAVLGRDQGLGDTLGDELHRRGDEARLGRGDVSHWSVSTPMQNTRCLHPWPWRPPGGRRYRCCHRRRR